MYLDPQALIEVVETYQPRSRTRARPPEHLGYVEAVAAE
jgi:hypothetical protein